MAKSQYQYPKVDWDLYRMRVHVQFGRLAVIVLGSRQSRVGDLYGEARRDLYGRLPTSHNEPFRGLEMTQAPVSIH